MSAAKKGPVFDGGVCRCCGVTKKCRLLNVEYLHFGKKEIYSEMFVDSFGLVLSHLEGEDMDRLICATCVTRLRDACAFRRQVLLCEERLLQARIQMDDDVEKSPIKGEFEVKIEIEQCELKGDSDLDSNDHTESIPEVIKRIGNRNSPIKKQEDASKTVRQRVITRKCVEDKARAKKEMLMKIKKMRDQLKKVQGASNEKPQPPVGERWKSPETKAFYNLTTLIEYSYVCPFNAMFCNYYCVYCKEMFTDPELLREHTLTHDPRTYKFAVTYKRDLQIDIARIDCRLCPQRIENLEDFYKHITGAHNKELHPNIKNEFLKFNLKATKLTCLECGGVYTNFHALKRHMAEHFGSCICDVCGTHFFDEHKLISHQKSHRVKTNSFPCKECGKLFKNKYAMYYHVSSAHEEVPTFHCYKCDQVFFTKTLRHRHMIEVHGELARRFPCDKCEKVFNTKKYWNEHNRKNHLQVLKHECSVCNRKFFLPSVLKDHMLSHTGERKYKCDHCGKCFARRKTLRVHIQSHETEKRHKCKLCNASYTQGSNLKYHVKTKH